MGWSKGWGTKIIRIGKILETNHLVTGTGTMTHSILLTRFQVGKNNAYLTKVEVRKDPYRKPDGQEEEEGWLQHCPLSYDQARCIHPPFVEYYGIQAFSIASDFDPKLMPKIQNQITMRKVIQSLLRVVQITIQATARIARNTTHFSPWDGGRTLSTT